jgi:nucleoside-diphosphate-sugar epimerase
MFVEDTARWLIELSANDALIGEVLNIGTGEDIAIVDLAHMIIEMTGSGSRIEHGISRPGDLPRLCADIGKANDLVDFTLSVSFADGLRATIDHFRTADAEQLLAEEVEQNWL